MMKIHFIYFHICLELLPGGFKTKELWGGFFLSNWKFWGFIIKDSKKRKISLNSGNLKLFLVIFFSLKHTKLLFKITYIKYKMRVISVRFNFITDTSLFYRYSLWNFDFFMINTTKIIFIDLCCWIL